VQIIVAKTLSETVNTVSPTIPYGLPQCVDGKFTTGIHYL
jgi:hypothetical protein